MIRNARLPSPAPVVLRLYEVLESGGADDIAHIIEADPALAARLLRLANSAFYASPPVASVRMAVIRVGTTDVAALALASEVMRIFHGIPPGQFSIHAFWEHSLWAACYSKALAPSGAQTQTAPLWLCGLTHDIGKLLLARHASVEYAKVLVRLRADEVLVEAEREILGFDHAQLGAELLRLWRLPEVMVECSARHHEPYTALDTPWSIVAAANNVANQQGAVGDIPGVTTAHMVQAHSEATALHTSFTELFSEYLR